MTDQVSISTAPQGSGLAATAAKAQSGGKESGFLGMLMAAIGRKPADGMGSASSLVHTGKNATKIAGKSLVLINAAGNGKQHAAATKSGTATVLIDAAAGNGKQHAAAKDHGESAAAASLIDSVAQAASDGNANAAAHAIAKDKASAQSSADQGSANKHAGRKHRNKDTSPSLAAAPIAVAMQQTATPSRADASAGQDTGIDAGSQGASQHAGSKPAGSAALNAAAHASLSPKGEAAVQDGAEPVAEATAQAKAQAKAVQPDAHTLASKAEKPQTMPASGQAEPAVTAAMLADANGQATTETSIQGRQGKARGVSEDSTKASSQRGDGQTTAAAAQLAKNAKTIAGITGAQGKAQAHTDADAHPGASHASDSQNAQAAATGSPKPGIHSYARVAAHTLAQATPTTAPSHQALPLADAHHEAAMAQASTPGQDLAMGSAPLTVASGVGQATPMPTPQMTASQAPVHASGPWTVVAAMTEIGQAAATGLTRLELKLEPAHLGKVHVRIDSDSNKNIQVHLVVEQPNSCQTIQQQLPNLRHALEQQGLNLGNFSMSSQGGGQGSGQPGQQAASVSAPGFNAPQAQAPQITNTPAELPAGGRLSIRV